MHKSKADGADRESLNTPGPYEVLQYLRNQDRAPAETPTLCEFDPCETSQSVNQGGVVQYSGSKGGTAGIPKLHDLSLGEISQFDELDQNFNSPNYPVASGSQYLSHGGPSNPVYQRNVGIHPGSDCTHGGSPVMNRAPNSYEAQYSQSQDRVTDTPMTAFAKKFDNVKPVFFPGNEDVEKQLNSLNDHDMEILQPVDQCNSGLDPNSNRQFYQVASGSKDLSHGGPSNSFYQRNIDIHPGEGRVVQQNLCSDRVSARSLPSLKDQHGLTPVEGEGEWTLLHKALAGTQKDIRVLLTKRKDIKTLLNRSSKGEYLSRQEMEILLRRVKFDVDAQDNEGKTLLHLLDDVDMISLLLQSGKACISIKDNEGRTPLLSAMHSPRRMRALLEGGGVDVNEQDDKGETLLHHAAYSQSSYAITILLEKGANVNARDNEGRTPLHIAIKKYNQNQHDKPFDVLLRANGIDVNIQDNEGRTALHDIILTGTICDKPKLEALLKVNKANVNIQDNEGKTPLHLLANEKTNGVELESHLEMVKGLLKVDKTSVNIKDRSGKLPLDYADSRGSSTTKALLQAAMQGPNGNMNDVNVENLYGPGMGR